MEIITEARGETISLPGHNATFSNWPSLASFSRPSKANIDTHRDGFFDYNPDGKSAVCLPVPGLGGIMDDTVAWFTDKPTRWWLRRGIGVVLGMEEAERAEFMREPLHIFDTPADWLAGDGKGACVLSWDTTLPLYLSADGHYECRSNKIATELRRALTPPSPTVRVEVVHA